MDPRVQDTIERMQEQLHCRLMIAELADLVELSVAQLTRLFRNGTGMTPHAFLHDLRMTRARILVERTSLPIRDVMAQVGISDRSHFARDFRRAHGLSPRALRVQLRLPTGRPAVVVCRNRPNGAPPVPSWPRHRG
jgi:transcriptional regulator GlxA family with amidase domain